MPVVALMNIDDQIPYILEPELTDKAFRKNWARLTRLWRADPKNI